MILNSNKRLQEIKLSMMLNRLKYVSDMDNININNSILMTVCKIFDTNSVAIYSKLYQESINHNLLNANKKELMATLLTFYNNEKMKHAKMLCISYPSYKKYYDELLDGCFINDNFVTNLLPIYAQTQNYYNIILILTDFIDKFKLPKLRNVYKLKEHPRTLELLFWLIYCKLSECFSSNDKVYKFLETVCDVNNIDFESISYLFMSIPKIMRSYPCIIENRNQFIQEVANLLYDNGYTRNYVGNVMFDIHNKNVYSKTCKYFDDIRNDLDMTYIETIDHANINVFDVSKFISIMFEFSNLEL